MAAPGRAVAPLRQLLPGIAIAVLLALLARLIAQQLAGGLAGLPKLPLSPVMCAVVLGMLWRNSLGVPLWAAAGLNWTMTRVLRIGIALVGMRLTLAGAGRIALTALPVALTCLLLALTAGVLVARALRLPRPLAALLAVGTAVCGCTAVVALAPVVRARHAETAFAVTCVVLFGCIAMLLYPYLAGHFFGAAPLHAGVFLGTAIHDTSQVIGAALIYSQQAAAPQALAAASVAKLLRNLSIAVLMPLAAWRMRTLSPPEGESDLPATRPPLLPFFVVGFLLCIVLRSAGDALLAGSAGWPVLVQRATDSSDLLLTCGMTAVGLSVAFTDMWRIGWRPLGAGLSLATLVGAASLALNLLLMHWGM
ncbi:MAG: putative sulfate exporter family transporter [Gammaproteobacteria bacterium]|nr:putative sulfate exporter family transporter [Gammaproteobacteria bacterium]